MRRCPKCGDFYADEALAFCLADGAPLVSVRPDSDPWREGARVVERKERALRRQTRRLRLRRVIMTTTTVVMTAVVITTVVVNAVIYLRPAPEQAAATPTPPPTPDPTPTPNETPSPTPSPSPSPSPSPTATPTPTPVYQISGRVLGVELLWREVSVTISGGGRSATTPVDAEGSYTFKNLAAGRRYVVTPSGPELEFSPPSRDFDNLSRDESANFSGRPRRVPTPTRTPTPLPDGVTSRPRGAL